MALVQTEAIATAWNITNADTYTTAAVTLSPNRLYLFVVQSHRSTGNAVPTSVVHDAGVGDNTLTLVNVSGTDASVIDWDAGGLKSSLVYKITVGSTTNNAAITISFSGQVSRCGWQLSYYTDYDTTTNFLQLAKANDNTGSSGTATATFGSGLTSGSAVHAFTGIADDNAITPEAGFTEVSEATSTESQAAETMYAIDGGDNSPSSTFTATEWSFIALEVNPAGAAAPPPKLRFLAPRRVWT